MLGPEIEPLEVKTRFGPLVEQILQEVEENGYDLVIVGERLRIGGRLRRFLGSASRTVAEQASCPVLVAKGPVRSFRHLLLCDGGAASPPLLDRFMAQLPWMLDAEEEITVLHVMSQMSAGPGVHGEQLRADVEALMAERAPEGDLLEHDLEVLERSNLHARAKVRHGLVVDEILEEARGGDYDLVIIGAHPNEGWRRILLDDLAHRLLVRLNRPVLVVR
jgi:nucleotide-binding universal stress UspA family protein